MPAAAASASSRLAAARLDRSHRRQQKALGGLERSAAYGRFEPILSARGQPCMETALSFENVRDASKTNPSSKGYCEDCECADDYNLEELNSYFSRNSAPLKFSRPVKERPSDVVRQKLTDAILHPPASKAHSSTTFVPSHGYVRLSHWVPGSHLASRLAECGDTTCGCYRPKFPHLRFDFRNAVVNRALQNVYSTGGTGVRYVSMGSGLLLPDFEILCGLEAAGCTLESVVFIDPEYGKAAYQDALAQLAAFFAPLVVIAFKSVVSYMQSCLLRPDIFGEATLLVQCDAAGIPRREAEAVAALSLAPGGFALVLSNRGILGSSSACRRRVHTPVDPRIWSSLAQSKSDNVLLEKLKISDHHAALANVLEGIDIVTGESKALEANSRFE